MARPPGHHGSAHSHAAAQAHDQARGHAHVHGHAHLGTFRAAHSPLGHRPTTLWGKVKQFLWGFMFFEWYHELEHEKAKYNDVMNLILFGEIIGIPLMNSSIGLRLLPYALPDLPGWKHRQLEEREIIEHAPHIH